jgi:hypothetical protein
MAAGAQKKTTRFGRRGGRKKKKTRGGRGARISMRHAAAFLNAPICARIASFAAADMARARGTRALKLRKITTHLQIFQLCSQGPCMGHPQPVPALQRVG